MRAHTHSLSFTHLYERRDDRAVEEALQEQQIRVVGNFAQFLDIVTYVHERGWNSNGALVHDQCWDDRTCGQDNGQRPAERMTMGEGWQGMANGAAATRG